MFPHKLFFPTFSVYTKSEVSMDWILDFLDPDSGCVRQDPNSRTGTGLDLDFVIC